MTDETTRIAPAAWALVPVKPLARAKTRLSGTLSPRNRQALQRAMLADVLAALSKSQQLAGVAVIASDEEVAGIARRHGASVIAEGPQPRGLNGAVETGTEALRRAGADLVAVIPADVPGLDPAEIDAALARARSERVTIVVPDRRGCGTNALIFSAEAPPAFQFGEDSFRRHLASASGRAVSLGLPSLALDIDGPADLAALAAREESPSAYTNRLLASLLVPVSERKIEEFTGD